MSTDYAEKEREFLASLKVDTGRDLGQWMKLISEQNLAHRNDIIDWLRQQGFMFSKASWLERIHHNGGKPIYADRPPAKATTAPKSVREMPTPMATAPVTAHGADAPAASAPPEPPQVVPEQNSALPARPDKAGDLDELLAKAKAYRPLAQFLTAEIARVVPGATFAPEHTHISIRRAREFCVLSISAKELRLGLDLGPHPFDDTVRPAKFTSPASRISPAITHMVVLTDARQVTPRLLQLVAEAAERRD